MSAELLNNFCLLFGPFLTGQMVVESHSVPRLSEGGESDIDELLISSAKIRVDVYRSQPKKSIMYSIFTYIWLNSYGKCR